MHIYRRIKYTGNFEKTPESVLKYLHGYRLQFAGAFELFHTCNSYINDIFFCFLSYKNKIHEILGCFSRAVCCQSCALISQNHRGSGRKFLQISHEHTNAGRHAGDNPSAARLICIYSCKNAVVLVSIRHLSVPLGAGCGHVQYGSPDRHFPRRVF